MTFAASSKVDRQRRRRFLLARGWCITDAEAVRRNSLYRLLKLAGRRVGSDMAWVGRLLGHSRRVDDTRREFLIAKKGGLPHLLTRLC